MRLLTSQPVRSGTTYWGIFQVVSLYLPACAQPLPQVAQRVPHGFSCPISIRWLIRPSLCARLLSVSPPACTVVTTPYRPHACTDSLPVLHCSPPASGGGFRNLAKEEGQGPASPALADPTVRRRCSRSCGAAVDVTTHPAASPRGEWPQRAVRGACRGVATTVEEPPACVRDARTHTDARKAAAAPRVGLRRRWMAIGNAGHRTQAVRSPASHRRRKDRRWPGMEGRRPYGESARARTESGDTAGGGDALALVELLVAVLAQRYRQSLARHPPRQ